MPGHKRNSSLMSMVNPYEIDITEIDGFDNLHAAEEILHENMQQAAKIYGAKYTQYLINGSTSGLSVAIAACTNKGDKALIYIVKEGDSLWKIAKCQIGRAHV